MKNAPHTPGPWTLETVKTQVGVCHKIGPFPGSCGKAVGSACVYEDGLHLHRTIGSMDSELLANARLIAAAPELLAVLHDFANAAEAYMRYHQEKFYSGVSVKATGVWPQIEAARAAIAKAEGR